MLIERITNSWVRWQIQTEEEKKSNVASAKKAFLWIIRHYSFKSQPQKEKILGYIFEKCPFVAGSISDDEIFTAFGDLRDESCRRGEVLFPAELEWTSKYVKDASIRKEMERLIYGSLLMASDNWDETRNEFAWKLSAEEKAELAQAVLNDSGVDSKRKMQVAKEFGLPADVYACDYFKKLLRDGQYSDYDLAAKLGVSEPDAVIDVIVEKINNRRSRDALEIAEKFLPNRPEIAEEIRQIRDRLVAFST